MRFSHHHPKVRSHADPPIRYFLRTLLEEPNVDAYKGRGKQKSFERPLTLLWIRVRCTFAGTRGRVPCICAIACVQQAKDELPGKEVIEGKWPSSAAWRWLHSVR